MRLRLAAASATRTQAVAVPNGGPPAERRKFSPHTPAMPILQRVFPWPRCKKRHQPASSHPIDGGAPRWQRFMGARFKLT